MMVGSSLPQFISEGCLFVILLFVFIKVYWCQTRFCYHMMFVSFNSNMTDTTSGEGTAQCSPFRSLSSVFVGLFVLLSLQFSGSYFVGHCVLFFCGHCNVCSTYGFLLPLCSRQSVFFFKHKHYGLPCIICKYLSRNYIKLFEILKNS